MGELDGNQNFAMTNESLPAAPDADAGGRYDRATLTSASAVASLLQISPQEALDMNLVSTAGVPNLDTIIQQYPQHKDLFVARSDDATKQADHPPVEGTRVIPSTREVHLANSKEASSNDRTIAEQVLSLNTRLRNTQFKIGGEDESAGTLTARVDRSNIKAVANELRSLGLKEGKDFGFDISSRDPDAKFAIKLSTLQADPGNFSEMSIVSSTGKATVGCVSGQNGDVCRLAIAEGRVGTPMRTTPSYSFTNASMDTVRSPSVGSGAATTSPKLS